MMKLPLGCYTNTPCNSSIFTSAKKPMTYTWGPMTLTYIYLPEPYSGSILPASIWFDATWSNNSINQAIVQCFLSIESLDSTQILGHLQICKASYSISQARWADLKTVLMGTNDNNNTSIWIVNKPSQEADQSYWQLGCRHSSWHDSAPLLRSGCHQPKHAKTITVSKVVREILTLARIQKLAW